MAFLCTFSGLLAALVVWVGLYLLASESGNPFLAALAPHLEAFSVGGWLLFTVLSVVFGWLTYRIIKPEE